MEKSCYLYSKIPGFRLTYGGKPSDHFTTFEIGEGSNATYLNLEVIEKDHEYDYIWYTADLNNNKSNLGGKRKELKILEE